ncbi:competence regulator inhibitor paratox [Streptococcus pluranimalium]|uniref:competence regulator inhibitor paratox n=1 Tax=Streptococcus pluranimalium TaxID=82348 RepID=UPI003F692A60
MIDLNDLHKHISNGKLDKHNVPIIRRQGKIVDYLLPNEPIKNDETIDIMEISNILKEVFDF